MCICAHAIPMFTEPSQLERVIVIDISINDDANGYNNNNNNVAANRQLQVAADRQLHVAEHVAAHCSGAN